MQEHFEFNPSYTLMTAALAPGEQIKAEPGAMVAYQGVTIETGTNGGMLKGFLKKAFTGESFFLNTFTAGPAGGWVSLAPGAPGTLLHTMFIPVKNCTSQRAVTWQVRQQSKQIQKWVA